MSNEQSTPKPTHNPQPTTHDQPDNRSPASLWQTMRRIIVYSYPYRYRMLVGLILTVLATLVWLVIPLGLRSLLDAVFHEGNRDLLNQLALGLLLLFVLSSIQFSSRGPRV